MGKAPVGQKLIIVGGGAVGLEAALDFKQAGKDVVVVEVLDKEAHRTAIHRSSKNAGLELISLMEQNNIPLHFNTRLDEVLDDRIVCKDLSTGKNVEFKCDNVLLAIGLEPLADVVESLRRCTAETEVFIVGDALAVGNIHSATNGGFQAAIHI
jgi:thioredoxin reductase